MKSVLIVGATSRIAEMTARKFAASGARLCLLARHVDQLAAMSSDLRIRGASEVHVLRFDAIDPDGFDGILSQAWQLLGQVDVVLVAYGQLIDQQRISGEPSLVRGNLQVNAVSTIELCEIVASRLLKQGDGVLAVITSVAGLRGRESNYVYGAGKAAVIACCSGLRQRLAKTPIHVLTILPGPVDTPMTVTHAKGLLWSTADRVANDIVKAIEVRKPVLYTPWFWVTIMFVVMRLPERVFARFGPK